MKDISILVVDDDRLQRKTLVDLLVRWGHQVTDCETLAEAGEELARATFDLVLLDMRLPDGDGLQFLVEQKKANPDLDAVIITAYADIQTAIAAIKCGAFDYLPKPFEYEQLEKIIRNACAEVDLRRRVSALSELTAAPPSGDAWNLDGIIVKTESARRIFETAKRLAAAPDTTVLILGQSGTGKGLLAKTIHRLSARAALPFIDINCSAIPEQLMESELFGYEKGAFTDAKVRKIGLLEAADGGTVFLDEIGDMSLNLQGKLLKVIEEKEFRRLGSARTTRVDVRVFAATNRDLKEREDLYYRLSVFPIELPPLSKRTDCILPLAEHYLKLYSRKQGRSVSGFSPDAQRALLAYAWPGNIRELCNVIERSVILCSGDRVQAGDLGLPGAPTGPALPPAPEPEEPKGEPVPASAQNPEPAGRSVPDPVLSAQAGVQAKPFQPISLAESEKRLIAGVLAHVGGNRSKAAEILKIHRTTLYKKIEEYKLS
jgi:DNA-binding NtrC family response regulator